MKVGDLVITKYKNRWNINCCGNIERISNTTADVYVYNLYGPGVNCLIKDIPLNELELSSE